MEKARWFLPLLDVPMGQASSSNMGQAGSVQAVLSEKQSLVDSQPIPFSTNPFVLARRQGPACLGRPPLGYSQGGLLKTSLYTKAGGQATGVAWRGMAWRGVMPHGAAWLSSLSYLLLLSQKRSPSWGLPLVCFGCT